MIKSLDAKSVKALKKGIKKTRSKSHCKSGNEQVLIVLYEETVVLERKSFKKIRRKSSFFRLFKALKFFAKLLRKIIVVKLFSL
jgi:hypothetical protein